MSLKERHIIENRMTAQDQIDKWILEALSEYNDGYTREYYKSMLKDIQVRLNELEFLKKD